MAESPPHTIDNPTTVKENLVTKAKGNFDDLYALLEPTALKGTATDAAARVGLEHSTLGAHTVDVISEKTAGVGVTVDGVKCKDNIVYTDGITEKTGSNDVPFSVPIQIDVIKEKTATSGVTVDSGLLKDGDFVANAGDITSFKAVAAEVYAARGSKASLDARLDVTLNEDGTIKDGVIVLADLADSILTADAAGRLKMADGFIVNAKITDMAASKLTGSLNANTVATASLQDGLLTADAAGRAKMANLFITDAKVNDVAMTKITGTITQTQLGTAQVGQAQLKTSTASVNVASTSGVGFSRATLPGGEYGFCPDFYYNTTDTGNAHAWAACLGWWEYAGTAPNFYFIPLDRQTLGANSSGWITMVSLLAYRDAAGTVTTYARQRYVTASGEIHWIFILRDKSTKQIISMWEAPDHPCFGNGGKPKIVQHPFGSYNPTKHEIIVINPSWDEIEEMEAMTAVDDDTKPGKNLLQIIAENYEIDEGQEANWPEEEVTVGLPKYVTDKNNGKKHLVDYRFMPTGTEVKPIKKQIPKPDYILCRKLRKK